ncbi:MAG: Hint domain-containing protein [Pseudomonadota bacterium]
MASISYSNVFLISGNEVVGGLPIGTTISETTQDGQFDIDAPETLSINGIPGSYAGTNADGDTFVNLPQGRFALFTNTDYGPGDNFTPLQAIDLVICFATGTRISTEDGPRAIEELSVGDLVTTKDRGPQPLRWIGQTVVSGLELARRVELQPVRFEAGALGNAEALVVSPQHRMMLRGWRAEALFGAPEVLIAAQDLINDTTIRRVCPEAGVTYWHMLFDTHELVEAEGCWSESLHPSAAAQDHMSAAARAEVLRLFPALETSRHTPVRPAVEAHVARGWA